MTAPKKMVIRVASTTNTSQRTVRPDLFGEGGIFELSGRLPSGLVGGEVGLGSGFGGGCHVGSLFAPFISVEPIPFQGLYNSPLIEPESGTFGTSGHELTFDGSGRGLLISAQSTLCVTQ